MGSPAVLMTVAAGRTCFVCQEGIHDETWAVLIWPGQKPILHAHEGCFMRAVEQRWPATRAGAGMSEERPLDEDVYASLRQEAEDRIGEAMTAINSAVLLCMNNDRARYELGRILGHLCWALDRLKTEECLDPKEATR